MSEEFEDEILLDDDEGGSNRPFILTAGALIGVMVVALLCYAIFNAFGGVEPTTDGEEVAQIDNGGAATATSISATNEAIATMNSFVTQTIESITLTASAPTETPTSTPVPPTNTPTATATATPTETPVVEDGEVEDDGAAEEEDGSDTNAAATSIFQGLNTATPTPIGSSGGSGSGSSGSSGSGTLPETGISLWGGLAAAFGLLMLIVIVRRIRAD